MPLTKDVEEAIKANLPGQTAGVLKKYFEDHEQLVKDFESKELELERTKDSVRYYQDETVKLTGYRSRLEEIEKGEKELVEKQIEIRIRVGILEEREKFVDQRVGDHKEMFKTVFRNTTVRTEVLKNAVVKNPDMVNYGTNGADVVSGGGERLEQDDVVETREES